MKIKVQKNLLEENNAIAGRIRETLSGAGVISINIMGSPGSGKTSLIEKLLPLLTKSVRAAVIEGDIASSLDTDRLREQGYEAVQINTDGACRLDANMVWHGISALDLSTIDILFIENVGNLVCPASCDIGESIRLVITSVPEGDDKPIKYPVIFQVADIVALNKIDMIGHTPFDDARVIRVINDINPQAKVFPTSCITGSGIEELSSHILSLSESHPPRSAASGGQSTAPQ